MEEAAKKGEEIEATVETELPVMPTMEVPDAMTNPRLIWRRWVNPQNGKGKRGNRGPTRRTGQSIQEHN